MAKRFTDTEIWEQDWFIDLPTEYKLFWNYVKDKCNHAGIFKVNLRSFCGLNGVKVTSEEAIELFNSDKIRIRELSDSKWYLEDFIRYQYGGSLNLNNRVHKSIADLLTDHGIDLSLIRGLNEVKEGSNRGQVNPNQGVKDKDKDKVQVQDKEKEKEKDSPKKVYGNPEINEVIDHLKTEIGGTPDGTVKDNRQYAKQLLDKMRKDYPDYSPTESVKAMITKGRRDKFWGPQITSMEFLYRNTQKIIQIAKNGKPTGDELASETLRLIQEDYK